MKIGIIDYGVGNIKSIVNSLYYNNTNAKIEVISGPEELLKADKIILPGVGAFGDAIEKIHQRFFHEAIHDAANRGKPILGICLGMQLLGTVSYEHGIHKGLNLIPGEIKTLSNTATDLRVPHIGWNSVSFSKEHNLIKHIPDNSDFYFVHSYYFDCTDPEHVLGQTDYGITFPTIIQKDNIMGAQFHPEKSQASGLKLLQNFVEMDSPC